MKSESISSFSRFVLYLIDSKGGKIISLTGLLSLRFPAVTVPAFSLTATYFCLWNLRHWVLVIGFFPL